ncbi:CRAL-TRIO domain-containing protein [Obelidium mucronatum]|nr:CRAL-TRIO domain-containing protein [Obelidium mucronatum]
MATTTQPRREGSISAMASRTSLPSAGSLAGISNSWLNIAELSLPDSKISELRDTEKKFLTTARELYKSEKVDYLNDHELLKFLRSNNHHTGKALGAVSDHLSWREAFKANSILDEDFNDLDQTGAAQFVGHTRTGVPILVLNNSRHKTPKDSISRDRLVRYSVYLIERARSEGILKDKLVVILDRFNTTNGQMDTYTLKALIPIFQKNYPETLQRLIIFPNTTMFWMSWKLMKGAIDAATVKKIEIRDNPETLIGIIDRDQLFEQYGGLVKDMYDAVPVTHEHDSADSNNPLLEDSATASTTATASLSASVTEAGNSPQEEVKSAETPSEAATPDTNGATNGTVAAAASNSPEVQSPPLKVTTHAAAPKPPTLAVPPLSPLVVELLWSAPEFDDGEVATAVDLDQQKP